MSSQTGRKGKKPGKKPERGDKKTPADPRKQVWICGPGTKERVEETKKPILVMKPATTNKTELEDLIAKKAFQIKLWWNGNRPLIIGPVAKMVARDINGIPIPTDDCPDKLACPHLYTGQPHRHIRKKNGELCLSTHTLSEHLVAEILDGILVPDLPVAEDTTDDIFNTSASLFENTDEGKAAPDCRFTWTHDPKDHIAVSAHDTVDTPEGKYMHNGIVTLTKAILGGMKKNADGKEEWKEGNLTTFFAGKTHLTRMGKFSKEYDHTPCGVKKTDNETIYAMSHVCLDALQKRRIDICSNYHPDSQSLATDLLLLLIRISDKKIGGIVEPSSSSSSSSSTEMPVNDLTATGNNNVAASSETGTTQ